MICTLAVAPACTPSIMKTEAGKSVTSLRATCSQKKKKGCFCKTFKSISCLKGLLQSYCVRECIKKNIMFFCFLYLKMLTVRWEGGSVHKGCKCASLNPPPPKKEKAGCGRRHPQLWFWGLETVKFPELNDSHSHGVSGFQAPWWRFDRGTYPVSISDLQCIHSPAYTQSPLPTHIK